MLKEQGGPSSWGHGTTAAAPVKYPGSDLHSYSIRGPLQVYIVYWLGWDSLGEVCFCHKPTGSINVSESQASTLDNTGHVLIP